MKGATVKQSFFVVSILLVLGGGPNRIGQGIELSTIMAASTPPSPSGMRAWIRSWSMATRRPLSIYEKDKPEGVVVPFGGQTPLNIAAEFAAAGVKNLARGGPVR